EALPETTPPRIRELIERCLEKDTERRLRDAGDARLDIERELPGGGSAPHSRSRSTMSALHARPATPWLALGGAIVAVTALGFLPHWGPGLGRVRSSPLEAGSGPRALVVLPSRDLSGSASGQLVGDGVAETLSASLGQVRGIEVVPTVVAVSAVERQG